MSGRSSSSSSATTNNQTDNSIKDYAFSSGSYGDGDPTSIAVMGSDRTNINVELLDDEVANAALLQARTVYEAGVDSVGKAYEFAEGSQDLLKAFYEGSMQAQDNIVGQAIEGINSAYMTANQLEEPINNKAVLMTIGVIALGSIYVISKK